MNLSQTISVYSGGQGSGCHGPNCGRKGGGHRVQESWKSPSKGFTYTKYSPTRRGMHKRGRITEKDIVKKGVKHPQVNQFNKTQYTKLDTKTGRENWIFDAPGATLFVDKYMKAFGGEKNRVVVHEVATGEYSHIYKTRAWSFNNIGAGLGFLKKRYGISL